MKIEDEHSGAKIRGAIDRSAYYAEIFRAYGYLRGRWKVFQDKRKGKRTG